jgi:3-deoxy-D-manno-octulosonic-acid transferase
MKRDDKKHIKERFGLSSFPQTILPPLWFHAKSIGETNAILPIIEDLKKQGELVLLTTCNTASMRLIEQLKKEGKIEQSLFVHQLLPYNQPFFINRFIKYWKPKALYWMEAQILPLLIHTVNTKSIPIFLLNARMSKKHYQRFWFLSIFFPIFSFKLWSKITKAWCQSEKTKEYLLKFGVPYVEKSTNIKFFANKLPYDLSQYNVFNASFKDCFIWCAASTHEGEEEMICKVHKKLKDHFSTLNKSVLLFLIPRCPRRSQEILSFFPKTQLSSQLYSELLPIFQKQDRKAMSDIILVDQIGRMGLFFALSQAVFIAGSFVPKGGHNPIEPWLFGKEVFFGKHMENFDDIIQTLNASSFKIQSIDELKNRLIDTFLKKTDRFLLDEISLKIEKQRKNKTLFVQSIVLPLTS